MKSNTLLIGLLIAGTFLLAYFSPNTMGNSDPLYSLLTSQAILEEGTVYLDSYTERTTLPLAGDYRIRTNDPHIFYAFPIGTSLLALPFVGIGMLFGADMANYPQHLALDNLLSAFTVALMFWQVFRLAGYFLDKKMALIVTIITVWGSSLMSTGGGGYWSSNVVVLVVLLALDLLVRVEKMPAFNSPVTPYLLGFLLFLAFFVRPSTASFIFVVFLYLLIRQRQLLIPTAITAAAGLGLFVLFSQNAYGTWLHPYYLPSRVGSSPVSFWIRLYGHTFSPSRGLFLFTPFLLFTFVAGAWRWRKMPDTALKWLALLWGCLHFYVLSSGAKWYGGFAFGPRLWMDVMPAFILLTILTLSTLPKLNYTFITLGIFAIAINTGQGLFNPATDAWNGAIYPNVTLQRQYLFDWRYPQPFATRTQLCQRNHDFTNQLLQNPVTKDTLSHNPQLVNYWGGFFYNINLIQPDPPHLLVTPDTPNQAIFDGWQAAAFDRRWAYCPQASLYLYFDEIREGKVYQLEIAGNFTPKDPNTPLQLQINNQTPTPLTFPPIGEDASIQIVFIQASDLQLGYNQLTFHVPPQSLPHRTTSLPNTGFGFSALSLK